MPSLVLAFLRRIAKKVAGVQMLWYSLGTALPREYGALVTPRGSEFYQSHRKRESSIPCYYRYSIQYGETIYVEPRKIDTFCAFFYCRYEFNILSFFGKILNGNFLSEWLRRKPLARLLVHLKV